MNEQAVKDVVDDLRNALAEAEFRRQPPEQRGVTVPYHGLFASVLHYPSVTRDLQQLVRRLTYEDEPEGGDAGGG